MQSIPTMYIPDVNHGNNGVVDMFYVFPYFYSKYMSTIKMPSLSLIKYLRIQTILHVSSGEIPSFRFILTSFSFILYLHGILDLYNVVD